MSSSSATDLVRAFDRFRETLLGPEVYKRLESGQHVKGSSLKKILQTLNKTFQSDISLSTFEEFLQLRNIQDDKTLMYIIQTQPDKLIPIITAWKRSKGKQFDTLRLHTQLLMSDIFHHETNSSSDTSRSFSTQEAKALAHEFAQTVSPDVMLSLIKTPSSASTGNISMTKFCDTLHILKTSSPSLFASYMSKLTPAEKDGVMALCYKHTWPSLATRKAFVFDANKEEGITTSYIDSCGDALGDYKEACSTLVADSIENIPFLFDNDLPSIVDIQNMSLDDLFMRIKHVETLVRKATQCLDKRKLYTDMCVYPHSDTSHAHVMDKYETLIEKARHHINLMKKQKEHLHAIQVEAQAKLVEVQEKAGAEAKKAKLDAKLAMVEKKTSTVNETLKRALLEQFARSSYKSLNLREMYNEEVFDVFIHYEDKTVYLPLLPFQSDKQSDTMLHADDLMTTFRIMLRASFEAFGNKGKSLIDVSALRFQCENNQSNQGFGTMKDNQPYLQSSMKYQMEYVNVMTHVPKAAYMDVMMLNKFHVLMTEMVSPQNVQSVHTIVVDIPFASEASYLKSLKSRMAGNMATHKLKVDTNVHGITTPSDIVKYKELSIFALQFLLAVSMAQFNCLAIKVVTISPPGIDVSMWIQGAEIVLQHVFHSMLETDIYDIPVQHPCSRSLTISNEDYKPF